MRAAVIVVGVIAALLGASTPQAQAYLEALGRNLP